MLYHIENLIMGAVTLSILLLLIILILKKPDKNNEDTNSKNIKDMESGEIFQYYWEKDFKKENPILSSITMPVINLLDNSVHLLDKLHDVIYPDEKSNEIEEKDISLKDKENIRKEKRYDK